MDKIISGLRSELIRNSDPQRKISGERFFREEVIMYGIRMGQLSTIAKDHYRLLPDKSKNAVLALCEELWQSGVMEESIVACNWSYNVRKQYSGDDIFLFEKWVSKYITNWATCDTLCNHSVGTQIEMYTDGIQELKKWALHPVRWMRRASAVSLIVPARKGMFLGDIFEIASILLIDKDDMVQKGYGWMLKEASKKHLNEVYGFVTGNRDKMPRTAFRYAIEKMPPEMRKKAMEM
jgi:3-methyladenine DNA glycosylase AlkD